VRAFRNVRMRVRTCVHIAYRSARTASAAASGWRTCPAARRAGCCGSRSCGAHGSAVGHTRRPHAHVSSDKARASRAACAPQRVNAQQRQRRQRAQAGRQRAGQDVLRHVAARAGGAGPGASRWAVRTPANVPRRMSSQHAAGRLRLRLRLGRGARGRVCAQHRAAARARTRL
jgi:hypothetical protein